MFLIPLIPHMELFGPFIHTDDVPILLFSIIFLLTLINEKKLTDLLKTNSSIN